MGYFNYQLHLLPRQCWKITHAEVIGIKLKAGETRTRELCTNSWDFLLSWVFFSSTFVLCLLSIFNATILAKIPRKHFKMSTLLTSSPQCCEFLVNLSLCVWHSQHHLTRWNKAALKEGREGKKRVIFPLSSSVGSHLQRCSSHNWPGL